MGTDDLRVGDAERRAALELLAAHFEAGRLDSHEYEDRRGRAADAVTRRELDDLFTDLPALASDGTVLAKRGSAQVVSPKTGARRVRDTVLALTPFIALALFFRTGSWLWFLLVPVVAIVASGVFDDD
ncbi:DUF1707 domain-containing protein [Intrasporangium sp.]|uniref:DUF1707 SHOCT-like domain-containing protein n=1 Tax=Intrasporangium sp. TaxID=1925024 RepID=UPI002939FCF7|nr:DUF1707 domain-containing protein [Intrasporangium sp.]MDV3223221.1 DUF1707 domain-containing protein [Intrasporangium sp.]